MPINASYEYLDAERKYANAQTLEDKIAALQEMIKTAPKHKGSENLLAELKTRLRKFLEKQEKQKSSGKSTIKSIKKEGFQCVLVGLTKAGKSSLLAALTNAKPAIGEYPFTTKIAEVGTMDFEGIKSQMVDLPSIGSATFDVGIANTADLLLIVVENLDDISKVAPSLARTQGRQLIIVNKADLLSEPESRKLREKIKSRKLDALLASAKNKEGLKEVKERIVKEMRVARVYLKEPNKPHSQIPLVIDEGATLKDVAEKIYKGFSSKIKETRITGPSSKFPNQKVGLTHVIKDMDIVEFHTV